MGRVKGEGLEHPEGMQLRLKIASRGRIAARWGFILRADRCTWFHVRRSGARPPHFVLVLMGGRDLRCRISSAWCRLLSADSTSTNATAWWQDRVDNWPSDRNRRAHHAFLSTLYFRSRRIARFAAVPRSVFSSWRSLREFALGRLASRQLGLRAGRRLGAPGVLRALADLRSWGSAFPGCITRSAP